MVFLFISTKSAMVALTSSFVLLTALVNGVFYIHQPRNAQSVFICLNKTDETWPQNWAEMKTGYVENVPIFSIKLSDKVTQYKIRILYPNRTHGDSDWKNFTMLPPPPPPPPPKHFDDINSTTTTAPPTIVTSPADFDFTIVGLVYYITFVASVQLVESIGKFYYANFH